jgi:hypothetical protein
LADAAAAGPSGTPRGNTSFVNATAENKTSANGTSTNATSVNGTSVNHTSVNASFANVTFVHVFESKEHVCLKTFVEALGGSANTNTAVSTCARCAGPPAVRRYLHVWSVCMYVCMHACLCVCYVCKCA